MKKTRFVALALLVTVLVLACGSSPSSSDSGSGMSKNAAPAAAGRKVPNRFPDFVKTALKNAPEDALVGIGSANTATLSQSRTISATRARAEIARQMNTMIQDMVTDYTASSEVDPSAAISFQETITRALSQAQLKGAVVVDQDLDDVGNVWTVVQLSKTSVVDEINQQAAAAKLKEPKMQAFDALSRMDAALAKVNGVEATVADK